MTRKSSFAQNPFQTSLASAVDFTIGAEAANVINVSAQFKDAGKNIGERFSVTAYLSDDANGDTVAVTAPTTVALGTNGVYIPLVAGKCFQLVTEATGVVDLNITLSSGADTFYLVVVLPDGRLVVSEAITFAA